MNTYFRTLNILTFCLALPSVLHAEAHKWKSKDGRTVQGEFISRDDAGFKVKRTNGAVVTIPFDALHPSSLEYLNENHPQVDAPEEVGNAFGPLSFGDSRDQVEEKLVNSKLVTTKTQKNLFGRVGLNGIFETAVPLSNLPCFLYFDWDENNNLNEITIRTTDIDGAEYDGKLQATWSETVDTLKKLYGKPLSNSPMPKKEDLQHGLMLASHLWRNDRGSILVGPGQHMGKYNVSIRFVDKVIKPVATP